MSPAAASWLEAAGRAEVAAALERLYAGVAAEAAQRRPVCIASGRCCHFEQAGHRLYATGLEAAYTVSRLRGGVRRGADGLALPQAPSPVLTRASVDAAVARGDCPFLDGRLCSVHEIKPLGCRVYYCDPAAKAWQEDLSERMLRRIRAIHREHGIEYRYGEWRALLGEFLADSVRGSPTGAV